VACATGGGGILLPLDIGKILLFSVISQKRYVLAKNWWDFAIGNISDESTDVIRIFARFVLSEIRGNAAWQNTPRLWLTVNFNSNGTVAAKKSLSLLACRVMSEDFPCQTNSIRPLTLCDLRRNVTASRRTSTSKHWDNYSSNCLNIGP
jgi:hypothetical protein